ncbi:MAG: glycosyltransferase [Thermoplasmata archaeon]
MIKNSTIITESPLKTGIGRYASNLYKLGFFEHLMHLSYNGKSDFNECIYFTKHWGINVLTSYYFGGVYKDYVKKYDYVFASSPAHFHLVKYNKNMAGTILDFSPIEYPITKSIKSWFLKNLKYVSKLKGVVTISDHVKDEAKEMFRDLEFTTIHLWIDNEKFKIRDKTETRRKLNLDDEKIYLLNVSGDVPRKNIDLLPRIMNKLDDRFVLIRIGESSRILPYFNNKKKIISLNNVPDDILPLYYNASDLLVHTAIYGGFEYPFIEAMFSDLKIMTFDIPISREILRDKGIFIPLIDKDSPDEWVDHIMKYYDKKIDYGELKNHYLPERAKKEYEDFFKKIGWI